MVRGVGSWLKDLGSNSATFPLKSKELTVHEFVQCICVQKKKKNNPNYAVLTGLIKHSLYTKKLRCTFKFNGKLLFVTIHLQEITRLLQFLILIIVRKNLMKCVTNTTTLIWSKNEKADWTDSVVVVIVVVVVIAIAIAKTNRP